MKKASVAHGGGGGGDTSLKEAIGDVPLEMGSQFHDWTDNHASPIFNSVTRMGLHIF